MRPALGNYVSVARIGASQDAVWRVLTDAAGYAAWNPEIVAIDGQMALNARIKAKVKMQGGAIRSVGMRVGRRLFTVVPRDDGAEFRMELRMTGPLAPLIIRSVGDRQPDIDGFSAALKARVEQFGSSTG
jgi:hypothetical protein